MSALPPKSGHRLLIISDLLETLRWTTTVVHSGDTYWVIENRLAAANADACL